MLKHKLKGEQSVIHCSLFCSFPSYILCNLHCMYPVGSVNSVYSVYSAYFLFWCQGFWGRRYGYWSAATVYCLSLNSNVSLLPYCLSSDTFGSRISFCSFSRVPFHILRQLDSMNRHVTCSCPNKNKNLSLYCYGWRIKQHGWMTYCAQSHYHLWSSILPEPHIVITPAC